MSVPDSYRLVAIIGFGSVWMLLWGAAAAVPVVIHFWSNRRYTEVPWAAMEYLLAALRTNSRRFRIEQLLLLAVRVAILLLLAFAVADPFLSTVASPGPSKTKTGHTHTVLILDGSYSMDFRIGTSTRFDQAQFLLKEMVARGRQGDGFSLVLMSEPARVIVGTPAFESQEIIREIDNLTLPHAGADLVDTLDRVQKIVLAARTKFPWLRKTNACFVTDLAQTTWKAASSVECRQRFSALERQASIFLFDLGQTEVQNAAVVELNQHEMFATVGRDVNFQAVIRNFGLRDSAARSVKLIIDGRGVDQRQIDVARRDEVTVAFSYRFERKGDHSVEVRLDADQLRIDNHRFLCVSVHDALRVLCVRGKDGAARNVVLALEPEVSDDRRVRTVVIDESELLETDPSSYDAVFLCNVGRFGRDQAGVLRDYLADGRGLVFFLGDQVQQESYNSQLGGIDDTERVLPAKLGGVVEESRYYFDPRSYEHPIVAPFRGFERAGLLTAPVWKYVQLELYDQSNARIALWFDNGDPAIVEEPILRGRSILVATSASDASIDRSPWSALSTWPSFPPLIQEMLARAVADRMHNRNLIVGQEIESSISGTATDMSLTLAYAGQSEQFRPTTDNDESRWTFSGTHKSGIYRAEYGSAAILPQLFAINIDTIESNPQRISLGDLPDQIQHITSSNDIPLTTLELGRFRGPLFQIVLSFVLLLLLVETYLARHFGRATA